MLDDQKPEESFVRFLNDQPAALDFFQSHSRLASAIAVAIRTNPTLKVVGLLGRWGSGKSTVVKHTIVDLSQIPSEFLVFNYDAWLHQSDPLRRSFLESIIKFFVDEKVIDSTKWLKQIDQLNGSLTESDTLETPILTTHAKIIAASLVPVPIGISLMGLDTIKEAWAVAGSATGQLTFWLSTAFLISPLIAWGMRQLYLYKKGKPTSWFPPFLTKDDVRRVHTKTLQASEPTSIEFGDAFRVLLQEVRNSKRRVVIVIDNLDRIGDAEALKMWASIRSFFLAHHDENVFQHEPYHPVVILPVDVDAIAKIFSSDGSANNGDELSTSFLNKTFDVTFQVTEPVMSDWRDFLHQQMTYVFGDMIDDQHIFWTRRFFEHSLKVDRNPVTPRQINKLINSIASLWLQWKNDSISFYVIAYYTINKKLIENDILLFIQNNNDSLSDLSAEWQSEIAALYFGVAPSKATQVLIEAPLREAILQNDRDILRSLQSIQGFGVAFEEVASNLPEDEQRPAPNFEIVTNAALMLGDVGNPDGLWLSLSWSRLAKAYIEGLATISPGPDLSPRVSQFFEHISSEQSTEFIEETMAALSRVMSADQMTVKQLESTAEAANAVLTFARQSDVDPGTLDLELDATAFATRLGVLTHFPLVLERVSSDLPESDIPAAVVEILNNELLNGNVVELVSALVDTKNGCPISEAVSDWSLLLTALGGIIRQEGRPSTLVPPALEVACQLARKDEAARTLIAELVAQGHVAARLNELWINGAVESLACCIAMLINHTSDFSPPPSQTWKELISDRPELPALILARLRLLTGSHTMDKILAVYEAMRKNRDLVHSITSHQIQTRDLGNLNVDQILRDVYRYRSLFNHWREKEEFSFRLSTYESFWKQLETAPVDRSFKGIVQAILSKSKDTARVKAVVDRRLGDASVEFWLESIRTGGDVYEFLQEYVAEASSSLDSDTMYSALESMTGEIAQSGDRPLIERWFKLTGDLRTQKERALLKSFGTELLAGVPARPIVVALEVGGRQFLSQSGLNAAPGAAVMNIVIPLMALKEGREILSVNSAFVKRWVGRADVDTKSKLENAFARLEGSRREDRRKWAKAFAQVGYCCLTKGDYATYDQLV